jgi:hypothetical protein
MVPAATILAPLMTRKDDTSLEYPADVSELRAGVPPAAWRPMLACPKQFGGIGLRDEVIEE